MGRATPAQEHMVLGTPSVTFSVTAQDDINRRVQGRGREALRLVDAVLEAVNAHSTVGLHRAPDFL